MLSSEHIEKLTALINEAETNGEDSSFIQNELIPAFKSKYDTTSAPTPAPSWQPPAWTQPGFTIPPFAGTQTPLALPEQPQPQQTPVMGSQFNTIPTAQPSLSVLGNVPQEQLQPEPVKVTTDKPYTLQTMAGEAKKLVTHPIESGGALLKKAGESAYEPIRTAAGAIKASGATDFRATAGLDETNRQIADIVKLTPDEEKVIADAGLTGEMAIAAAQMVGQLPYYIGAGTAGANLARVVFSKLTPAVLQKTLPTAVKILENRGYDVVKATKFIEETTGSALGFGALGAEQAGTAAMTEGAGLPEALGEAGKGGVEGAKLGAAFKAAEIPGKALAKMVPQVGGVIRPATTGTAFAGGTLATGGTPEEAAKSFALGAGMGLAGEAKLLAGKPAKPIAEQKQIEPQIERRTDLAQRKKISEMTDEEKNVALSTDELTGLGTRRAWEESPKEPVQVIMDSDGLKYINDNLGYDSGDKLLIALADAWKQAGVKGFRAGIRSDEISAQSLDEKVIDKQMADAYNILKDKTIVAQRPDGTIVTLKGLGFSYGYSRAKSTSPEDIASAQAAAVERLHAHKEERTKLGLRANRGEEPPGISVTTPTGIKDTQGGVTPPKQEPQPQQQPAKRPIFADFDATKLSTDELIAQLPDIRGIVLEKQGVQKQVAEGSPDHVQAVAEEQSAQTAVDGITAELTKRGINPKTGGEITPTQAPNPKDVKAEQGNDVESTTDPMVSMFTGGQEGSIGGKPFKPALGMTGSQKAQAIADVNRKAVKEKFKFNIRKFVVDTLEKGLDIGSRWKLPILKDPDGRRVIMMHDTMRGASAEAKRVFEDKVHQVFEKFPQRLMNTYADFRFHQRIAEIDDLRVKENKPAIKHTGGETGADAKQWLNEFQRNNPNEYNLFAETDKKFQKAISEDPLNQLVEEGLITPELRDDLLKNHAHYNPRFFIQHIDPDAPVVNAQGHLTQAKDSGLKALDTGSEQAMITNPLYLLSEVTARTQGRIFKNRASRELHDYAEKNPKNPLGLKVEKPTGAGKFGNNTFGELPTGYQRIFSFKDGQRQAVLMPDEFAKAWVSYDPQMQEGIAKVVRTITGTALLKPLATGYNPSFILANLPRDMAHIWLSTKEYNPIAPIGIAQLIKDMISVAPDVIARKGQVIDAMKQGLGMDYLSNQGQVRLSGSESLTGTNRIAKDLLDFAGYLGETSELWTRMALRNRAIKNGKSEQEATWIARNYMDFAQGGSWSKAADNALPYFNAAIQGTRGVFRALREDPKTATFKIAQVIATGIAMGYWNKQLNQDAWESVSDREKSNKFIFTTPVWYNDKNGEKRYIYFALAKDQAQAVFAAIGELLGEKFAGGNVDGTRFKYAVDNLTPIDQKTLFGIPLISALGSYFLNKDFWNNQEIWTGRAVSPKEEYTNETPKEWVALGKLLGISPDRSKSAVSKFIPENNEVVWLLGGGLLKLLNGVPLEEKDAVEKPIMVQLAEAPLIKRIIRQSWPKKEKIEKTIERVEQLKEKGVEIPTTTEEGKPRNVIEMSRDVRNAELTINDKKTNLDRNFDKLATQGKKGELDKAMAELEATDKGEFKRIAQRLKEKFPETRGDEWFMSTVLKKDARSWKDNLELMRWLKKTPISELQQIGREHKINIFKERDQLQTSLDDYLGRDTYKDGGNKPSHFEQQRKDAKKQVNDGEITIDEAKAKIKKINEDEAAFRKAYREMMSGKSEQLATR